MSEISRGAATHTEMGAEHAPAHAPHGDRGHHHVPWVPVFTGERKRELDELLTHYPNRMAALLPALWIVQEERGWVSDEELPRVYARAQALLFPGEEDLGLMPIEAMASGCPVVALARGGALETVGRGAAPEALARAVAGGVERVPGGVLFGTESVEGLIEGIHLAEREHFDPAALRAQAEPFSAEAFDQRFRAAFERAYAAWKADPARRAG